MGVLCHGQQRVSSLQLRAARPSLLQCCSSLVVALRPLWVPAPLRWVVPGYQFVASTASLSGTSGLLTEPQKDHPDHPDREGSAGQGHSSPGPAPGLGLGGAITVGNMCGQKIPGAHTGCSDRIVVSSPDCGAPSREKAKPQETFVQSNSCRRLAGKLGMLKIHPETPGPNRSFALRPQRGASVRVACHARAGSPGPPATAGQPSAAVRTPARRGVRTGTGAGLATRCRHLPMLRAASLLAPSSLRLRLGGPGLSEPGLLCSANSKQPACGTQALGASAGAHALGPPQADHSGH